MDIIPASASDKSRIYFVTSAESFCFFGQKYKSTVFNRKQPYPLAQETAHAKPERKWSGNLRCQHFPPISFPCFYDPEKYRLQCAERHRLTLKYWKGVHLTFPDLYRSSSTVIFLDSFQKYLNRVPYNFSFIIVSQPSRVESNRDFLKFSVSSPP